MKVKINPVSKVRLLNPLGEVSREFDAKVTIDYVQEAGSYNVTITAQEDNMNPNAIFEESREYAYPTKYGLKKVVIENPVELRVSDSGHHYLTLKDGTKKIMPPGWIEITIKASEWTLAPSVKS